MKRSKASRKAFVSRRLLPALERLEERTVPSASLATTTINWPHNLNSSGSAGGAHYGSPLITPQNTIIAELAAVPLSIDDNTSTSLISTPNPSNYGDSVNFTATISAADMAAGIPTGAVTFTEGATTLAAEVPVDGSGDASFSTSALGAGSHTITASFTGTNGWLNSSGGDSSSPQLVQYGTSTSVVSPASTNANPSQFGQSLTFTASVTNTSGTGGAPTGQLTFFNGTTSLGTRTLFNGTATLTLTTLAVGDYSITASYNATGNFAGSSSPSAFSQTVTKIGANTSAVSASSSNPPSPSYGQPLTFTAAVTNPSGAGSNPTGSVTFYNGSTAVGTRALVSGTATLTLSTLPVGTASITATYLGAGNFAGSSSPTALSQSVSRITTATSTVMASSGNPASPAYGQSLTFTAAVSNASGTGITPTGSVTFYNGSTNLGTRTLMSGTATISLTTLPVGTAQITATYPVTSNFAGSSSPTALAQSVSQASTSTSVVTPSMSNPANPTYGQSLTFTSTVSNTSGTGVTPTGTVTFYNGSTSLGTRTVFGGTATLTLTTLPVGTDQITANYNGTTNFSGSSSPSALSQTVTGASTSTSDVSPASTNSNPSTFGQSLTFSATITNTSGTGVVPTGLVTFYNGSTSLGARSLVNGTATITLSKTLTPGNYSITATYSGTANFAGSSSPSALSQTVQDGTTTTVVATPNPSNYGSSVTFTATITAADVGAGVPTGTVTFSEGSTTLASDVAVNNLGVASFNISTLAVGDHTITASFSGTNGWLNSSGDNSAAPLLVQDNTSTAVTSSPNPSSFGGSVTFTATVSAADMGAGIPAGSVTFMEGSTTLAANVPVDGSGNASFSISPLAVGNNTITASFTGTGGWLNSSGDDSASPQLVQDGTSTTVSSTPNPSNYGDSVTFTAAIAAADMGAGIPMGTVTFMEGASTLAANVPVDGSGDATCSTAMLPGGSNIITANFTGTNGWLHSSGDDSANPQIVQDGTSTTVSSTPNPSDFGTSVTFTAAIAAADMGAGIPTGTVTFSEGGTTLASDVSVDGSGTASFSISTLTGGSHTITANFTGTGGWQISSGDDSANPQIVQDGTTTAVSSTPNPSSYGDSVTFTAAVSAADMGAGVPTGSVTFMEGGSTLAANVPVDGSGNASFSISTLAVGSHTIAASFTGTDGWQNSNGDDSTSPEIVQDGTTTSITSSPNPSTYGTSVTFTAVASAADMGAGVPTGTVTFSEGTTVLAANVAVDGSGNASFSTSSLTGGSHTITASFTGTGGWQNSSGDDSASPQIVQDGTSTSLTSAPNPSNYGVSVTFTATVTAADMGAGVPTGTVTFSEGSTVLAASVPVDGSGNASFSTSMLTGGSHTITASFTGTNGWQNSSGDDSASPQIVQDGTSTAVSSTPNPSILNQSVTFTAAVSAADLGAGIPTGTVTFMEGAATLAANVPVDGSGNASFNTSSLAVGSNTITAYFTGTNGWQNCNGTAPAQTVQYGTSTSVVMAGSTNANPSTYGQSLTFTATVADTSGIGGTPKGQITFYNGTTSIGARTLVNGTATLTLSNLPLGTDLITATYPVTGDFATSSSASALSQTISGASTSTSAVMAASTNTNPSVHGQSLTFTATVTNTSGTGAVPTGLVTFYNGTTSLGARSLLGGTATLTLSTLSVGSYALTASYAGAGGFTGSASPGGSALSQTVTAASTSTSVVMAASSNTNPSTYGTPLTFTAMVTNTSGFGSVPTGTVTFYNGSTALGTRTLAAGVATLTLSNLPGGTDSITAVFNSSTNFMTSSSPSALSQTVNPASTSTGVTANPNPATLGQLVTLSATVTNTAGTSLTPTGTVTFKDVSNGATTTLGTRSLVNGVAIFTTSTLKAASHTIEAFLNVTNDFLASSDTAPEVVL